MDSLLCSAYSTTKQSNISEGSTKPNMPNLTVVMNVSVFDHVSCESQAIGQSFTRTKCRKVAGHGIDAANGVALMALVAD